MPIYKVNQEVVNRLQALAMFVQTSRLNEANTMTIAGQWANGRDIADTLAGRTMRETVRKSSIVRILADADERAAWDAAANAASVFDLFAAECAVTLTALKNKGMGPVNLGLAIVTEFREWLTNSYVVDVATREAWLDANKISLSLKITQV